MSNLQPDQSGIGFYKTRFNIKFISNIKAKSKHFLNDFKKNRYKSMTKIIDIYLFYISNLSIPISHIIQIK
jgi:hypothetical protein